MTWIQYDHSDDLPTAQNRGSQFTASIERTEQLLEAELEHLKAGRVQILTGHTDSERTRSGRPSIDPRKLAAITSTVRVIVPDSKHGPLSWTASRYGDWTANLRAIALTLKNLRAIDRYGATTGEQYRGFKALPAGDGGVAARQRLGQLANVAPGEPIPENDRLVRLAVRATHPDTGAPRQLYDEVIELGRQLGVRI